MNRFKIKGISLRINDTFYVDVEPSKAMENALIDEIRCMLEDICDDDWVTGYYFLNVAYNEEDNDFNLSTWIPELDWVDIPYECSNKEKKAIVNFVNQWKDKVPENINGLKYIDDTEYVFALSEDIPWKEQVLR